MIKHWKNKLANNNGRTDGRTDGRSLVSPNKFHMKMDSMGGQHLQLLLVTEKSRGVPLSYVIRKYTLSPEDSKNRDVQIIYQKSLVGNMFTRDSKKVLDVLK